MCLLINTHEHRMIDWHSSQQAISEKGVGMIKILLVDDQPLVRQGLRMRLELEADIQIVGEAADGRQAVKVASEVQPDVVIMDVEMPHMDGVTATANIHESFPEMIVIMLSIHDNLTLRARARAAGAVSFVEKRDGVISLLKEIRQAIAH